MLRKGSHSQAHGAALVEAGDLRRSDDAHEARSEATLGRHQALGGGTHLDDGLGGGHVLGEVEVVQSQGVGHLGEAEVQVVGQTREHGLGIAQFATHHGRRRHVGHSSGERRGGTWRAGVDTHHLEPCFVQQRGGEEPHLAQTQHRDPIERHTAILARLFQLADRGERPFQRIRPGEVSRRGGALAGCRWHSPAGTCRCRAPA